MNTVITEAHNRALNELIECVGQRNYWRHHSRSSETRLAAIADYLDTHLLPEPFITDLLKLLVKPDG